MSLRIAILLALCWGCLAPVSGKELTPQRHGYEQGKDAGRREGRERVGDGGYYQGERDGYAAGALDGQRQRLEAAWAQGLALGQKEGSARGAEQGDDEGREQGRGEGGERGELKARQAADEAARQAVTARAESDGKRRAAAANPQGDGEKAGREAGLSRAREQARELDYAKARSDYRARQFAQPAPNRSDVRQAPLAVTPHPWPFLGRLDLPFGRPSCPSPDWRYLRYGSDNEEYQRGYRQGYAEGMRDGFEERYQREYRHGYDHSYALGLLQAQAVDVQATADDAYRQGFDQAHETAYQQAYQRGHQQTFEPAFEAAYAYTYAQLYPEFEKTHYQSIEQSVFQSEYGPPYQAAYERWEAQSYQENYPKQAKLAYDEGWKAEAQDFVERPVRLLQAWRTATDVEGVELLTVRLRNFSAQPVPGSKVRVSFGAQTSRLYHPLPPESEVTVTGLLRLRGVQPDQAELFAVFDNGEQRLPLGTVNVTAGP